MYFIKEHVITQIQKDYGYTRKQALDFYDRIDDECRAEFDAEYYAEAKRLFGRINYVYLILLFACISLVNPFVDVSVGRCLDEQGNGKEYNGEPYYNYINYVGHGDIHTDDIVITGFILNEYGECEERLFDVVVLKDTPFEDVGVN